MQNIHLFRFQHKVAPDVEIKYQNMDFQGVKSQNISYFRENSFFRSFSSKLKSRMTPNLIGWFGLKKICFKNVCREKRILLHCWSTRNRLTLLQLYWCAKSESDECVSWMSACRKYSSIMTTVSNHSATSLALFHWTHSTFPLTLGVRQSLPHCVDTNKFGISYCTKFIRTK